MTPISPRRTALLRAIHQLGIRLRRPPTTAEIAREFGRNPNGTSSLITRARLDGHVVGDARPNVMTPRPIRLTPGAMAELGIPLVVYLAWPGGDRARGAAIAAWLAELGLWAVSPYLGTSATTEDGHRGLLDAAVALAQRADAALAWSDPLLIGHPDIASAMAAGVPVGLVLKSHEALVAAPADLWKPPILVTPQAGLSTRR